MNTPTHRYKQAEPRDAGAKPAPESNKVLASDADPETNKAAAPTRAKPSK